MLERVHVSVFQQLRAFQHGEKIFFHGGKGFSSDGIPRDQDEFHRLCEVVLVQPETFAQQAAGAAANRGITDFFAGDDSLFFSQ